MISTSSRGNFSLSEEMVGGLYEPGGGTSGRRLDNMFQEGFISWEEVKSVMPVDAVCWLTACSGRSQREVERTNAVRDMSVLAQVDLLLVLIEGKEENEVTRRSFSVMEEGAD